MQKSLPNTKTLAWIIAALLIAFLVAQPLPYFTYGDGQTGSVLCYLAMPDDYPELTAHLETQIEGFTVNDIVGAAILPQIAAIILLILVIKFRDNVVVSGFTGLWGIASFIGYCASSALRLGGGTRTIFLILFAATALVSIAVVAIQVISTRKNGAGQQEEMPAGQEAVAH